MLATSCIIIINNKFKILNDLCDQCIQSDPLTKSYTYGLHAYMTRICDYNVIILVTSTSFIYFP
jgi:hypothetical protein